MRRPKRYRIIEAAGGFSIQEFSQWKWLGRFDAGTWLTCVNDDFEQYWFPTVEEAEERVLQWERPSGPRVVKEVTY